MGLVRSWLKALGTHTENIASIPSIHMEAYNHLRFQFHGIRNRFLISVGTKYKCDACAYMWEKHRRQSKYKSKWSLYVSNAIY